MLTILLTGSEGQIGQAILKKAENYNFHLKPCSRLMLDITNLNILEEKIEEFSPHIIINAAAYTAVDKAESEVEKAFKVNLVGVENLVKICRKKNIFLLHFSTDYIFDGRKKLPYTEIDNPCPINIYGKSKWEGEKAIFKFCKDFMIFRISWVFSEFRHNFLTNFLNYMQEHEKLTMVLDQIGCPTYAGDVAELILFICQNISENKSDQIFNQPLYHYCNSPAVSRVDFLRHIFNTASQYIDLKTTEIKPILTQDYPTPAKRPLYSVLDTQLFEKYFGEKIFIPSWIKQIEKIFQNKLIF